MAVIDTEKMTPEDIAKLRAAIGMPAEDPRSSPVRKPLTDLREPTTAKGRLYRPHFEFSADAPPEGTVIPAFPTLRWDTNGVEHRVESADALAKVSADWTAAPPMLGAVDSMAILRAEFESLSPADQQFVIDAQQKQRLDRMQTFMSNLSESDLASLKKSEPMKAKKTA